MIRNKNTGRLHADGCPAIGMMNPKNIDPQNPDGKICKWCGATEHQIGGDYGDDPFKSVPCHDQKINSILEEVGCTLCGSKHGIVLMYPHDGGLEVKDAIGKQWVYFHCYDCNYDTNFKKASAKYQLARL